MEFIALPAAKFAVPSAVKSFIPRARLKTRLDLGLEMKLTVVKGPAGFGKTSLVADWGRSLSEALAWITLDEDDNDPMRFLESLIRGIRGIEADFGKTALEVLASMNPPSTDDIINIVVNELGNISRDVFLVLDDCHVIQSDAVHQALARFLQFMPLQAHMVMLGREEPAIPLARLRVDQQLNEIDALDLKFDIDETRRYLGDVMRVALNDEQIARLHHLTEGWIAGLRMSAFSILRGTDPEEFVSHLSGANRHIFDYLDEEVFDLQPDYIKDFLIRTAILESFNPALCNAVTGRTDSAEILKTLDDANLFVFPLDNTRNGYRYHRFFADGLKARLEKTHSKIAPDLYLRASDWCRETGMPTQAVKYALAGGHHEAAARLISDIAEIMVQKRETRILEKWFDQLPEDIVLRNPLLALYRTHILVEHGHYGRAADFLQRTEQAWIPSCPENVIDMEAGQRIEGGLMALNGFIAFTRGDFERSRDLSRRSLERLDDHPCTFTLLAMTNIAFTCYFEGRLDETEAIFQRLCVICRRLASPLLEFCVVAALAAIEIIKGRLRRAEDIVDHALAPYRGRMDDNDQQAAPYGILLLFKGYAHWEHNDLEEAEKAVVRGLRLILHIAPRNIIVYGYLILAAVFLSRRRLRNALEVVREAEKYWPIAYHFMFTPDLLKARIDISSGRLKSADDWLRKSRLDNTEPPAHFNEMNYYPYFTLARYYISAGRPERVFPLLTRMADDALAGGRNGRLLEIRILQSLACDRSEDPDDSLRFAVEALNIAAPEGYTRIFIDEGDSMREILSRLEKQPARFRSVENPSFLKHLLAGFSPKIPPENAQVLALSRDGGLPWSYRLDPLTQREIDVLEKIALGMKNQEIADMLFISVGTVKNHIHRILSKLEVENRTQAVYKARKMGLIQGEA